MVDISQNRGTPPSWWPAATVAAALVAVTFAMGFLIETLQRDSALEHERSDVLGELSQIRARLESIVSGNLLAIRGISAVIATQPDMSQREFARIARGLISDRQSLRNIAGAPGLVVSLMYPTEGNESAIGLDYRAHPVQREAALRAVETGQTVVAGPLTLVQGGVGLIAREPVFVSSDAANGDNKLWGLVSAVLDAERLYELAGLTESKDSGGLAVAIRGRDGLGSEGETFFGDPSLFESDVVTLPVTFAGGSWQMAATPRDGWRHAHDYHGASLMRIGTAIVAAILAVMGFLLTRATQRLHRTSSELAKSQAIFTGFMRHLPAGAFVHDPTSGETVFENGWMKSHLGNYRADCGAGGSDDLQVVDGGRQLVRHDTLDGTGETMHCETLHFVLDSADDRRLVAGVVMDISERVAAESRLADNRARLRTLLDTVPDLVWLKDPDGRYLACNKRFEALFGASESEILGKTDYDFVAHELADFFRQNDAAAIAAGEPVTNEETVVFASDGHEEALETIKAPVRDDAGTLIGVLGVARDITERKRADAKLRAAVERLAAAERVAHIGNWEYLIAQDRLIFSDESFRLLGLDPNESEISLDWIRGRVHPDDLDEFLAHEKAVLNSSPDTVQPTVRFRMQRADGAERILSMQLSVDFDAADAPVRVVGTVQDVTESERLNQDLQSRLEELTRWQSVMLGRENRVQELKREVNDLLRERGQSPRYPSQVQAS